MLEGEGIVLKGRIEVCHGRMARVPRLCEKAEVGKAVLTHQGSTPLKPRCGSTAAIRCMDQEAENDCEAKSRERQIYCRFSHLLTAVRREVSGVRSTAEKRCFFLVLCLPTSFFLLTPHTLPITPHSLATLYGFLTKFCLGTFAPVMVTLMLGGLNVLPVLVGVTT